MIYLNNSATSYPKPERVISAVINHLNSIPAEPHRSGYIQNDIVNICRNKVASFFNVDDPSNVIFTSGSTEALNLAIFGLHQPKHLISTTTEHNSVLRPLKTLEQDKGVKLSLVDCDNEGFVNPLDIEKEIRKDTSAIIINHCSNVTGAIQNIETLSTIARKRNITLIVDASQSAGAVDINLKKTPVDLLAFTGHKSLFATTGIGGLIINPNVNIKPLKVGGTGIRSDYLYQPEIRPVYYEAGTHNLVGLASLSAGLDYIMEKGIDTINNMKLELYELIVENLIKVPEIILYGCREIKNKMPIINFSTSSIPVNDLAYILSESFKIIVRAGLHCSPLIHKSLGSLPEGTIRVSFSPFNTKQEVLVFIDAVKQIVNNKQFKQ